MKINRLVIIGNGFDLSHGLKTSYTDFINAYCENVFNEVIEKRHYKDEMVKIKIDHEIVEKSNINDWKSLQKYINDRVNDKNYFIINNKLLEGLIDLKNEQNWVDIEQYYYDKLIGETDINTLNKEWKEITEALEKYLVEEENSKKEQLFSNSDITTEIYAPFNPQDIMNDIMESIFEKEYECHYSIYEQWMKDIEYYDPPSIGERNKLLENHIEDDYTFLIIIKCFSPKKDSSKEVFRNFYFSEEGGKYFDKTPQHTLFLNFNYTSTPRLYIQNGARIIQIHGSLKDKTNPIIFGYGDELDEHYNVLENKRDNALLKNMKSIKYLETNNYKKLLTFINSNLFQVYILGHSCGNSDRTLLNTIFEHQNCISVKPYYYLNEKGEDNYSEISINISRNFGDKALLRDKVVNKENTKVLFFDFED